MKYRDYMQQKLASRSKIGGATDVNRALMNYPARLGSRSYPLKDVPGHTGTMPDVPGNVGPPPNGAPETMQPIGLKRLQRTERPSMGSTAYSRRR